MVDIKKALNEALPNHETELAIKVFLIERGDNRIKLTLTATDKETKETFTTAEIVTATESITFSTDAINLMVKEIKEQITKKEGAIW